MRLGSASVTNQPLTVAVLGAGGTIAPAIVRDLAEAEEVNWLKLIDLDLNRARGVAESFGLGKASVAAVSETLTSDLKGCDLVVNSANYSINLKAMEAALEAGCHYLDLGGLFHVTSQQLELNQSFQEAGLLAVLGIGASPGKTNLMAARAARELSTVERIDVSVAGLDLDPPSGFSAPYSLKTMLDELTIRPVVVRAGQFVELEPMSSGGEVEFPEPFGRRETVYTLHSEMLSFPTSFNCQEATFRLSLERELMSELQALIGADSDQIAEAAKAALPPGAKTVVVHLVEASGRAVDGSDRAVTVTAVTRPIDEWGLGGGVVSTGAPAAAAVRMIARGQVTKTGVLPPELCIEADLLFTELEKRGTQFTVQAEDRN